MTTSDLAMGRAAETAAHPRYDRVTIAFHWGTALCVVLLFSSSYWWNALPGGTPLRKSLQAFHVSIGILFVLVFLGRVLWRWTHGRKLAPANTGAMRLLSSGMHGLLYLLLVAQVVLGFALRWAQGEEFYFFGTFSIPEVLGPSKRWAKTFEMLHNDNAWIIVVLAAGHAVAALTHHYAFKDGVLRRMLPLK